MSSSVTPEQVKRFAKLFRGSASIHGRWSAGTDGKKAVKTVPTGATPTLYASHLEGEGAFLGVPPLREDSTCLFGAIDIDDDGVDHHALEAKIQAHALPLIICRSKSGGAHLYLFTETPVDARMMVETLKKFRKTLDYDKNANGMPVEIFPKQVKHEVGRSANWINLPYWDHAQTNRYAISGGRQLSLDEFFDVAEHARVSERRLLTWADPSLGPFADGPPCLQQLHAQGFQEGGRNNALLNTGIFFKLSQAATWQDALREYNETQVPEPVDQRELDTIIRSLDQNEYAYTCAQHPICTVCNKPRCRKQPFGIGHFIKKSRLADLPELSDLVKITTEPARYKVRVNGVEVPLSESELENPAKFSSVCLHRLNLVIPTPRPSDWKDVLKDLVATRTEEAAPSDSGDKGILLVYFDDFMLQRFRSDTINDVLRGGYPARDVDGRVYFKSIDFLTFIRKRGFQKFDLPEIYAILRREVKLEHGERTILGKTLPLWSVDEPSNEQQQPFTLPKTTDAGY